MVKNQFARFQSPSALPTTTAPTKSRTGQLAGTQPEGKTRLSPGSGCGLWSCTRGRAGDACAVRWWRPLRAARGRQRQRRGRSVRLRARGGGGGTLQGLGCSRSGCGHGATGEAAQGAEVRPAAEVSRGSPSWAGRPAGSSASRPGLSERAARSGLFQASRRAGPGNLGLGEPTLGAPRPGALGCPLRVGTPLLRGVRPPATRCAVRGSRSQRRPGDRGGSRPRLAVRSLLI